MSTTISVNINQLKAVALAAGREDVRYYLNGVLFQAGNIVATDGCRVHLARGAYAHDEDELPVSEFIMPIAFVDQAVKAAPRNATYIDVTVTSDPVGGPCAALQLSNGLRSLAMDGKFPDWQRVMPPVAERPPVEPCAVDPVYYHDMFKACRLAQGYSATAKKNPLTLKQHGDGGGIFFESSGGLVEGRIMPVRL